MVLAAALVPAAMAASVEAASAAPGDGGAEGEKATKTAEPGFTTEGSKRLTTSESS